MRSSDRGPLTYCQSNCIINKKDMTVKPVTIGWPLIGKGKNYTYPIMREIEDHVK